MEESLHRRISRIAGRRGVQSSRAKMNRPLPALPPGREVTRPEGSHYLVERPLAGIVKEEGGEPIRPGRSPWEIDTGRDGPVRLERPLFFDLETTGFSSTPLFLSAVIDLKEGVGRQRFARDYSEEKSVIAATAEEISAADGLVTFNGKSYDLPLLRNRAACNGVPFVFDGEHVDLLHISRRAWKGRFPDFRLQTLEKIFGGGPRTEDIPGEEIPLFYHDYVRRGYDPRVHNVLRHNMRDVVTLVRLFLLHVKGSAKRREGR